MGMYSSFGLTYLLDDGAPYPKMVRISVFFFFAIFFLVYLRPWRLFVFGCHLSFSQSQFLRTFGDTELLKLQEASELKLKGAPLPY